MLSFGIQIMKTGQAFNTRYSPLMWNDVEGAVPVDLGDPRAIPFTVYETGSEAMHVMSQIEGVGTRLVYLPSNLFPPTNTTNRGARTSVLEFQLRDALASSQGSDPDLFYNFNAGGFLAKSFDQTKGDSAISRTSAVNIRDIKFRGGEIYELIQQTYNVR